MILPWRRKRRAAVVATELTIPTDFRCPISLDLMKDPVTLSTGITYDRNSIETWIIDQGHHTCPVTKRVLPVLDPVPNHAIRRMIQDWCVEKKSYGVERIPTPRAPLSSLEASDLLARLESASTAQIANPIIARILNKARESERNRRVILSHGGSRAVSSKFEEFCKSDEENGVVLDELLSCLALLSPALDILTAASLKRVVWVLKNGDLASRQHAVSVLKEAVSSRASELESGGALEGLVNSVKDPVSPSSLKDSLYVIYHILRGRSGARPVISVVELGLVSEVVEIAVGSEKSLCEMALGVLDEVCREARGRVKALENAMTVAVVVKKMLRVSDLATEFSVSVLWRLSREEGESVHVLGDALEVGAFQKLLLVLQVGFCGSEDGATKEKVTDLLKRLNVFQRDTGRLECVESMDFKDLKRSF